MKNFFLSAAVALLAGLTACSPNVNVEQKAGTNFSQYRSYAWADTEVKTDGDQNPLLQSPIAQDDIKRAIESELSKRGLREVADNPDFYLTTHFYVEEAERTVATTPPAQYAYPYSVRYRGALLPVNYGYWYRPRTTLRTEEYREGTLVLDFIDAKSMDLVWRGSIVDPVNDPARLGGQFSEAARDILDEFPVAEKQ